LQLYCVCFLLRFKDDSSTILEDAIQPIEIGNWSSSSFTSGGF
jgi:hypothetical protein